MVMNKLTEIQAEALKSAVEEKLRQFCTDMNNLFKEYNVAGSNSFEFPSSPQKDESLDNKEEIKDDRQNNWEMKFLITSKEMSIKSSQKTSEDKPDRLVECKVVNIIPLIIECS